MNLDKKIKTVLRENILQEGLIKSCNYLQLVKLLKNKFNKDIEITYMDYTCLVISVVDSQKIENIEELCFLCGWYCAVKREYDNCIKLQIEAKFQEDTMSVEELNNIIPDIQYIYHLTPYYNLNKIIKYGLIPHSNNKEFSYPDRIYFTVDYKYIKTVASMLYVNLKPEKKTRNFVCLICDLKKINSKTKFSIDPNAKHSIFTMDNIPITAIIDIKDIYIDLHKDEEKKFKVQTDNGKPLYIKNRYNYDNKK